MAPNVHCVSIVSPNVHDMGHFRHLLATIWGKIGLKSSPNVLLWGLQMAPNGPKWSPNDPKWPPVAPTVHCVSIVSPTAHDLGDFRPLSARKRGEISLKSAPNVSLWGLKMALNGPQMTPNGPQWPPPALCVHSQSHCT